MLIFILFYYFVLRWIGKDIAQAGTSKFLVFPDIAHVVYKLNSIALAIQR